MRDFFGRLFSREEGSKKAAKDRLRLVLVHDRTSLSPHLLDTLKEDLIQTISKYLEIDTEGLEVNIDQEEETMALVASIPIRSVRRGVVAKANS
ncbi:MAG: cell division topological specificity factor MinE [Firmicutes bacterium]|nr:cell division topological specificity factor MinE [Bacillota bacterium]MBO2522181.1 cell division topological specificity factor MinE [Bacillota bacterium]